MFEIYKINDSKFKSISINFNFFIQIKNEMITKNAIMSSIMSKSSNRYTTQKDIEKSLYGLYGAKYDVNIEKYGDIFNVSFMVDCINKNFLPNNEDVVEKCLEFLKEVIYNPFISNEEFNKEIFEREKEFILNKIKERKDDKIRYAIERTEEIIFKGEPFGNSILGNEEDIEKISSKDIYEQYKFLIENSYINVVISGNLNGYENIESKVREIFDGKIKNIKKIDDLKLTLNENNNINEEEKVEEIFEKQETSQSVITMAMKVDDIKKEELYSLLIYNAILGGTPNSKLFRIFREKESLAYTVRSRYNRFKNFFVIYAGIEKTNYEKSKRVLKEQLDSIKNNDITDEELSSAIDSLVSDILEYKDSNIALAKLQNINHFYYKNDKIGINEMVKGIQSVKKENIVEISKKINIDKIYLLGGDLDA